MALAITYGVLIIIILLLLIWLVFIAREGIVAFWEFLKTWYLVIALSITGIIFHREIVGIVRFILGKLGVKI